MARRHYRIRFPLPERPRMFAELSEYAVLELSESGASVTHVRGEPAIGQTTDVRVALCGGVKFEVRATLLRQEEDRLILEFNKPVPFGLIIGEQTRLAAKYPKAALTAK